MLSVRRWLSGLLIVAYFAVFMVWLPSFVLKLGAVGEMNRTTRDLIGSAVWAVFLAGGLWGLRILQRRRVI